MRRWQVIVSRLAALVRRPTDREVRDELEGYVAQLTDRYQRNGLSAEAARRAALVEAGGLAPLTEQVRAARVGFSLETTWRDVCHGARIIRRDPGYAVVVVLTMALGIGVTAAMFGVIQAVLWRPLPYPDANRLMVVEVDAHGVTNAGAAPGEALDLRANLKTLTAIASADGVDATLNVDGVMDHLAAVSATDDVLMLLGASPMWLGRPLRDADDEGRFSVRAIVISYDLWTRRFHGDPSIIGRHVEVNNLDVEIVGVTRPGFQVLLPPDNQAEETVDIWFPTGFEHSRSSRNDSLLARLSPSATREEAQAELDAMAARFVRDEPAAYPDGQLHFRLRPLREVLTGPSRAGLLALGAAVGFVLLIACVNVANMLLARVKYRERELAVRGALGASRPRLVRQLLAENVLLAALGGFGGWLLATEGVRLIAWIRPPSLPRLGHVAIDPLVLWVTIATTTLAAFAFGLLPAWVATDRATQFALQTGRGSTRGRVRQWQRRLAVAEVALSILPLVCAGLMARTFVNLSRAPLGFDPSQVVTASVSLSFRRYPTTRERVAFLRAALDRVRQLPGVDSASLGGPLPFSPYTVSRRCAPVEAPTRTVRATQLSAMPGFLRALGIRLVAGRDFTDEDLTTQGDVVIIDQTLARALWPDHPIGRRLVVHGDSDTTSLQVIGLTTPLRTARVRDASGPALFVPYQLYAINPADLVAKTSLTAATIGQALKATIETLGPGRPVFNIRPLAAITADSIAQERFTLVVLAGFASAALFLAAIGLFGTLSYLISQRQPEFGLRLALGASNGSLLRLVVIEGALLTFTGLAAGLFGTLGIVDLLRNLLYGVAAIDPLTLIGVTALVASVALAAVARPAWRAAHVDPTVALRAE